MRGCSRPFIPWNCREEISLIMASFPACSAQDALAALRLHQEWGVDAVMEDMPWDVWGESLVLPDRVRARQKAAAPVEKPSASRRVVRGRDEVLADIAAARDVAALLKASQQLPGVGLMRTAKHHLAPVIVEGAPFLLVGDVPNEDEDRHGTLFAGPMGALLDRILASIGLKRSQLSMAPAIPWRPPGGQRASQRDVEACLPILHRAVALARPRRIVTMGSTPAAMLLQNTSRLSQLRGRWHEAHVPGLEGGVPLLPLWHPAQLGETAGRRKALWADMLLLDATLSQEAAQAADS
ncbi:uracil-DNA glycosylase [Parasaccharibacter sp. TMW2.1890]|uniref:uracil-DNA glycosylase n=1 Tax=Parasaccharibacter sp. TMW2.1890 TaxID=2039289 RepID=UPI002013B05F|nr:uracil-DNA glycosylase [Parasaccharibacter sp. TMW2.1890]MCL1515432.1 uracil-DNA glycosylase [Parasaccharibacter sp. TMW2.1890]